MGIFICLILDLENYGRERGLNDMKKASLTRETHDFAPYPL
jgi:hypothetical protein